MITIGIAFYGVAVPVLEINSSHLFNPLWTPHARLHEAWQLITNSAIALLSLWMVWRRGLVVQPGILGLMVMGGFLVAYAIRNAYDGSMSLSDGSEKAILGINLGLAGFGLGSLLHVLAIVIGRFSKIAARIKE